MQAASVAAPVLQRADRRFEPGLHRRVPRAQGVVALICDGTRWPDWSQTLCEVLQRQGFSTLLCEPLGAAGPHAAPASRDLDTWVRRVLDTVGVIQSHVPLARGHTGLFATGLAAAAALQLAAERPALAGALVTWGARIGPVAPLLGRVHAASMLIAGSNDSDTLPGHCGAMRALRCEKRLEIVPGAGPALVEAADIDLVAHLAGGWFSSHLASRPMR